MCTNNKCFFAAPSLLYIRQYFEIVLTPATFARDFSFGAQTENTEGQGADRVRVTV